MAESDAAGPGSTGGPKARTLTREDLPRLVAEADREWQSLTPAEQARRKAEAEKADREAYEAARRAALPTLEALERMAETASRAAQMAGGLDAGAARLGIPAGPPYEPASIPAGLGHHRPLDLSGFEFEPAASAPPRPGSDQRPRFEVAPPDGLLSALREAFPGFKPTDRWWSFVEMELKTAHHRSNPEAHDAFCAAFWGWTSGDLVRHLEDEGRIKRGRVPRGKSVCERLRELHNEDADFAETAPERAVAQRIGKKSAGSLSKSAYWQFTLKPRREEVRARARLARAGVCSNAATPSKAQARSENWNQREVVRRLDAQIDGGH